MSHQLTSSRWHLLSNVRSDELTAVTMSISVFRDVAPCSLVKTFMDLSNEISASVFKIDPEDDSGAFPQFVINFYRFTRRHIPQINFLFLFKITVHKFSYIFATCTHISSSLT
jgi:hypothetical protein